ncbi:MAG TPA: ABC transporter permease [Pyrinomonadaceae bacterium]|jgi:putative ABC transport system permease protein|nr:ABC transporter permease [Pyrinomonadaceae bacterium]
MTKWRGLARDRLRWLARRRSVETEMEEELRFHLRRMEEQNVARGMGRAEAARAARRRFGDLARVREGCRDVRGGGFVETLWQDLRYGVRSLAKSPGVTLVIVLTLALGAGANAAIFSVVEAVLLRPLPFGEPERIVGLRETLPGEGTIPVAYRTYAEWRERCGAIFESVAASSAWRFNLEGGGDAERVDGARVTGSYFDVMGVSPLLGRTFRAEELRAGAPRAVVIEEGLWRRRFGGSADALGQKLRLDGVDYEVVGVMPAAEARGETGWASVWVPMVVRDEGRARSNPFRYLRVNARLRAGATLDGARSEIARVMTALRQEFPDTHGKPYGVEARQLRDFVVPEGTRSALLVLSGVVALVLLIACANVANLLLARSVAREREIAVRVALGASRGRIVRQLLTESLLLSAAGGTAGLALAHAGLRLLVAASAEVVPRVEGVRLDAAVFGFALVLSALAGLLFGLAPALAASKVDLNSALKEGARGAGAGLRHRRLRDLLVVSEIALALTLLVASGLLIKSYLRLREVPAGFDADGVLTAELNLPSTAYNTREKRAGFFREAVERARRLPGVEAAAAAQSIPLREPTYTDPVLVEGRPVPPRGQVPFIRQNIITPDYFRAMGMRLVKGRGFTEQETWEAGGVIVVNETFARKFFAGEEPLGRRVRLGEDKPWMTVVGVVGDTVQDGFDSAKTFEEMFYPYTNPSDELPLSFMTLVVRSPLDTQSLVAALRAEVRSLDAGVPVSRVQTMRSLAGRATSGARLNLLLTGLFAALALALAALGIYGLMAYSVTQRTHEIGIRMALGARAGDVLRMIVGRGMRLALLGVAAGIACALALTRLASSLLFGVSATDPLTFAVTALLLVVVALAACLVPAWRATRVDPLSALRQE